MRRVELTDGDHGAIVAMLKDQLHDYRTPAWHCALGRDKCQQEEARLQHIVEQLDAAETF